MDQKDKGMLQTDLNKLTLWAQKWKMELGLWTLEERNNRSDLIKCSKCSVGIQRLIKVLF